MKNISQCTFLHSFVAVFDNVRLKSGSGVYSKITTKQIEGNYLQSLYSSTIADKKASALFEISMSVKSYTVYIYSHRGVVF